MKTIKNKICAVLMILLGLMPVFLIEDATALIILGCLSIPLFFAKKNWVC